MNNIKYNEPHKHTDDVVNEHLHRNICEYDMKLFVVMHSYEARPPNISKISELPCGNSANILTVRNKCHILKYNAVNSLITICFFAGT